MGISVYLSYFQRYVVQGLGLSFRGDIWEGLSSMFERRKMINVLHDEKVGRFLVWTMQRGKFVEQFAMENCHLYTDNRGGLWA